jgi:hypothetical protein
MEAIIVCEGSLFLLLLLIGFIELIRIASTSCLLHRVESFPPCIC